MSVAATCTSNATNGPMQVASRYAAEDFDEVYDAFKTAVGSGGYRASRSEKDVADAEVAFSGHSTTGQAAIKQECKGRTTIRITIRPA